MVISLRNGEITTAELATKAGVPTINIGTFINTVLDFVVVAFVIFMVIRWMNRLLPTPVTTVPAAKTCPYCQSSIPVGATRCPQCTSELPAAA